MNYYQEITLIDQMDVGQCHVYSAIYQDIHKGLRFGESGEPKNIGISFPKYQYDATRNKGMLGNKMRLFAQTKEELEALNLAGALREYADYSHISSIKEVGDKATHYEVYYRSRAKGVAKRASRLHAHLLKKFGQEWIDKEFGGYKGVLKHCEKTTHHAKMPSIRLKSVSNGHCYSVIFERQTLDKPATTFLFDSFGLSSKDGLSTVPAW
jgi:CRISPR-associated endonuclease Csy4